MAVPILVFLIILVLCVAILLWFPAWSENNPDSKGWAFRLPSLLFGTLAFLIGALILDIAWEFNEAELAYRKLSLGMDKSEVLRIINVPVEYFEMSTDEPLWDDKVKVNKLGTTVYELHYFVGYNVYCLGFNKNNKLVARREGLQL